MRNPPGYWTKDRCHQEALKFTTRKRFSVGSSTAYSKARKKRWLDDICSHMIEIKKPSGYWTKELCHKEAIKYNHRYDFDKKSHAAYVAAVKNKWLDDICAHMKPQGSINKRKVYSFEFSDKHVYVGLSYNPKNRKIGHFSPTSASPVKKHFKLNPSVTFNFKILTEDFLTVHKASLIEIKLIKEYKKNGWILLNTTRGGEIGGNIIKWTKEKCHEEALKYKSRSEFQVKSYGAYKASIKNKWLDEHCSHMVELKKPAGYWTKEKCKEEALKYKSRSEFQANSGGSFKTSIRNNWLDYVCSHMIRKQKPAGYWTKKKCYDAALSCASKRELKKKFPTASRKIYKNNWKEQMLSHMI